MVYESDFYTTRRPYRPSYSTYTTSSPLSRQIRILPGLGKVHVVHTYDRIVPYVGHKRLTVVTAPPRVYSTRPSVLQREYDWIENRIRPWVAYSPTNRYLNSDSAVRYVYVRNPISGLKYHAEYNPSRYYNFYRIIRPFTSYDDLWPYYRPYYFWPSTRPIRSLDIGLDYNLNRSNYLAGLYGSYYRWLNNYHYYRYVKPTYYPDHSLKCYYCLHRDGYHSPTCKWYYPVSTYSYLDTWYPRRSYYWSKYLPIYYTSLSTLLSPYYFRYLTSIFDDETRLIRAQTASLLKQVHLPVPRIRTWPITPLNRYGDYHSLPAKYSNDTYIHKLLTVSPNSKVQYATYYTEPVKKYIGDKSYSRRRPLAIYEDALRNDIQLLSYYINRFREEKAQPKETKVPLSASRPSRIFSPQKPVEDTVGQEIKDLRDARAARLAKIYETDDKPLPKVESNLKSKKQKEEEEARIAEEKALAEEKARKELQAKKEAEAEAARKAEQARQEQLAAQAAAERAAELERQAEKARQEELAKQAEIEKARQQEEERIRQEEQRRLEEEARAEEERQQLLRLEEIARQAEEEKEAELARQAEELAELARQEAELAELERKEREEREQAQREAELAELARQEAELAELERQERELEELARQEAELAAAAQEQADAAAAEAEEAAEQVGEAVEPEQEEVTEVEEVPVAVEEVEPESEVVVEEVVEEPAEEEEEVADAEE